jgi:phosphoglycolate phosphatase
MKNSWRLVVFDWEGTLGDPFAQILNAIVHEAKRMHFGEVDPKIARQVINLGPVVALKKLFPHLPAHQQSELLQASQRAMLTRPEGVCITDGAREVLEQLRFAGVKLAIATNKGHQSLVRDLEVSGLSDYFQVTRSASQAKPKPHPQMLLEIMDVLDIAPEYTLMIGDSVSDIEMANAANVRAIGVDFYSQNEPSLRAAGAMNVFDRFQQLADYLGLK